MSFYINGNKKIKSFYINVGGQVKELKGIYANQNGKVATLFSKEAPILKEFVKFKNTEGDESIVLDPSYMYYFTAVGDGGSGGSGGGNWGLYEGGGGGAGQNGGIAILEVSFSREVTVILKKNSDCYSVATNAGNFIYAQHGENGNNGEDAGAFNPFPSGGASGKNKGESKVDNQSLTIYGPSYGQMYQLRGTSAYDASGSSGRAAEGPAETEFTKPQYIAQAGQNGYFNGEEGKFCLGCAGGGGNSTASGGTGGSGGIVIYRQLK